MPWLGANHARLMKFRTDPNQKEPFMADSKDPRLDDETRLQEFRRLAAEIAADAPTLARIAIEGLIRNHNPWMQLMYLPL